MCTIGQTTEANPHVQLHLRSCQPVMAIDFSESELSYDLTVGWRIQCTVYRRKIRTV